MIIPVRCFTCGKVIANKWEAYCEEIEKYEADEKKDTKESSLHPNFADDFKGKILDELGLTKICCRRHMLGHVPIIKFI